MPRKIILIQDGVPDARRVITDDTDFDFDFASPPLDTVTFEAGVQISSELVTKETVPFTTEAVAVATQPVFLSEPIAGYPIEIQPATFTGTPAAQATRLLELNSVDETADLSETNIYDVPTATDGQTLEYSESAGNNVVDGVGDPILATTSVISATVLAPVAPTITASDNLLGRTLVITVGSVTGAPTPTTALTTLTLDGSPVSPTTSGSGVWIYEVPDDGTDRTVSWEVTATNGEGTATASGSETVLASAVALDPDAVDYISRVQVADTQALETAVVTAIDNFFVGVKADGDFSALKASCILAGARTLDGATEPLVASMPTPQAFNFDPADYDRKTGLIGNATTKYIDSNFSDTAVPQNDLTFGVYITENPVSGNFQTLLGVGSASNGASNIIFKPDDPRHYSRNRTGDVFISEIGSLPTGYLGTRRTSSANYVFRRNSSETTITETSQAPLNADFRIFGDGVTGASFSASRVFFYHIGTSLDMALLEARLDTLMADLDAAIA